MQGGLVNDWARGNGFAIVHQSDGQPIKPLRPFTVQMPLDGNAVDIVSHMTLPSHYIEPEPLVVGTYRDTWVCSINAWFIYVCVPVVYLAASSLASLWRLNCVIWLIMRRA